MTVPTRRYRVDRSARRFGSVLIGGSPLRLFRLTERGERLLDDVNRPTADSPLVDRLLDAGVIHPLPDRPGRYSRADVTVVVPTWGVPAHPPLDGIVVDDGSEPPLPGATVRLAPNAGPAAARNAGLRLVTTDLVAFVDSDVAAHGDWLEHLLPHFDDDRIALVAPRVLSRRGLSLLARYETHASPLDLGAEPARVRAGSRVSYVPAAAIVCRVAALTEIGGFDDTLRFGEDVDLVWRLDQRGWRVRYEPGASVEHDPRADWRSWWRQRNAYGSSAAPLARRHPGALAPLRVSGWSLSAWALAVAWHPLAAATIALGSAAALVRKLGDVPARESFRLAWSGNLNAGVQIALAVRRGWWPIVAVAALRSRFARRVMVAAVIAARNPVRVADDLAYSVGVWRGMIVERTAAPLVPDITSWPGRRSSSRVGAAR
ncbi:MAG: mycofactocin biosynthesis glycosyltransferase MftF [Ilumatobacteraceae bacterium]